MYPQRSVMTCGLATALEPPHFNHAPVWGATEWEASKFAALLAAICARIGSRKAKSKAGFLPPFFVSLVAVWGMAESAYAGA